MYQNGNFDEVHSSHTLNSQHVLSRSKSRLQSNIQRIDSHIKSTLPFLQGKTDKKYIFMKIDNFFEDNKIQSYKKLRDILLDQFKDKIEIKYFKQCKELLKDNYNDNQLHYIIVPKIHLDWASTFAKQEREENNNKVKIYVYGILKKLEYQEKVKARSKKKLDAIPDYIDYFFVDKPDYPQEIAAKVELHLSLRLRQEGKHVKTWALTNKYSGKKVKKRTLHFFYQEKMEAQFIGIYKTYKKKSKASWLQIYSYKIFEDVLKKIRQRELVHTKQIDIANKATSKIQATSKILMSQSNVDQVSMRSGIDAMGSQLNSSVLSASIRAINKLDQNDLNIIIVHGYHSQIQKFRSLVRAQKYNNWFLWQIAQASSDVMTRLRDFLNVQAQNNEIIENQQYQRMIHCKHLNIMAHNNDDTTICLFQNQKNTLNHMQLLIYNDTDEFSLLLRQGITSHENFTIAVVPGGFRSFAPEYLRVIKDFNTAYGNTAYGNGDAVQNFKFVSSAMGRHGSNIFLSSNLLGTQSNLNDVRARQEDSLQNIMKERDKLFHPFEGLTGYYVYLLYQQSIQDEMAGLKDYIDQNPRIVSRSYMDKQWLKQAIESLTVKDSVIVITTDLTLREAQYVLDRFQKVYIMNITDRQNPKPQKKVMASGNKNHIYDLIKTIPTQTANLENQVYQQTTKDMGYIRKNRLLPKDIEMKPGIIVTLRMPASLKDEQSHKMETRLLKNFYGYIQIEYYKNPKEIRLLNKAQQLLSFIVWAYNSKDPKQKRQQLLVELQFLKQLAAKQHKQLRQQFLIYTDVPDDFKYLIDDGKHTRFKFISSRWERIQEYIVGLLQKSEYDTIPSDMTMIVFYDESDRASADMIQLVNSRRDSQKLHAANHIQFRSMEDIKKSLDQQSPLFKYYIVINQNTKKFNLQDLEKLLAISNASEYYIRVILLKDESKKPDKPNSLVRKAVSSYQQAGGWLCNTVVQQVKYYYIIPHILIDKNTQYYYFLDKYSQISKKFTFAYFFDKEELKRIANQKRDAGKHLILIIVSQIKNLTEYSKALQKCQNYKNGNIKFIYEGGQKISQNLKSKVVFKNPAKKQIEKFLLNIYRRDKHTFFSSSLGTIPNISLLILNINSSPFQINQQQIAKWQNILKARIERLKDLAQLSWMIQSMPNFTIYIIAPYSSRQQVSTYQNQPNIKWIFHSPKKQYDFRNLDQTKIVQSNSQLFRGTYPAEITDYLRYLRYNIRKPQAHLQKTIKNEIIQLYFQEEYKLNMIQLAALTKKNDSLIINKNGYKAGNIMQLLKTTSNFNYLHVFVGDESSGKQIIQFNKNFNRDIRFIDMKTSELSIMRGESKNQNWLLETNDTKELITYLLNLPENRYQKAINHKGKFNVYVSADKQKISSYLQQLKNTSKRNTNIQIVVNLFNNFSQNINSIKKPAYTLIHAQNEKLALQNIGKNQIYYIIVSEQPKIDKSYASTGNKHFIAKKKEEFKYFINQLPTEGETQIQPCNLPLNDAKVLLNNIRNFTSISLPIACVSLSFFPSFKPISLEQTQLVYVDLLPGTIDDMPPTLSSIDFPKADLPPQPLGVQVLTRIKDCLHDQVQARIVPLLLDFPPSSQFKDISNYPDKFNNIPLPLKQMPIPQSLRPKLAILHPNTFEFTQVGEVLKRNLQPDQFSVVTLISFKTELDLEQYSKNNGQKLNGYDKIVVFLSNIYRKYDPILKIMKSKLGGRMQYFIFDDNFHLQNHHKLKLHLRPYRIKKLQLPYQSQTLPKFINHCAQILILVPYHLLKKYEALKSANTAVTGYGSDIETHRYLHSQNTFIILVATKQNYHHYKLHAKISPSCILLVDTQSQLPQDELYLYRIWVYTIYYGQNGEEYLKKIIPSKPIAPYHQKNKNLFYSVGEEELVFVNDYDEYQKIFFTDWNQLYKYIAIMFKGRNNWLIKNSPGKPQLIPLHPVVYLQNKQYMKDFKNSYSDRGYLNEQNILTRSQLVLHEFSDLPEVHYTEEKELTKHLQKQQAPSVVLFDSSNLTKMSFLRARYNRHKWIGLTDNTERWIDPLGVLLDVNDIRLKRKQDIFANMFNKDVFEAFKDMKYFYLSNKANLDKKRNILFRTKEELLQTYQNQPNLLMVLFVQAQDINHVPQALMAEANQPNGRVKLILLKIDFVDDQNILFIKFNEIDPVIKHINDVQQAGRIDFMVYHQNQGERTVQTLIQKKRLRGLDDRVYTNMQEVEDIAIEIKGKYRKVYVVCFEDERQQIQNIFNKYSIKNKGIPGEGVQYHLIDRKSFIIPNSSRIQPYGSQQLVNTNSNVTISATTYNNLLPTINIDGSNQKQVEVNVAVRKKIALQPANQHIATHHQVITITYDPNQISEENQEYGLPNMDSNIRPDKKMEKMESILSNKNFNLQIDEKLKNLFPVGKFFANRANFFNNPNSIPQSQNQAPQVIIATQVTSQIINLSQNPDKLVIVVGNNIPNKKNTSNLFIMAEDEIPGLIRRLEGSNVQDELTNLKNIDDYNKVRVVYDRDIDFQSKRRLLAASDKNQRIYPIVYKNVNELKSFLHEPDSLLLLMMKQVPPGLEDAVQKQHKTIVKKKKIKMILPKKSDSDINGLETILEQEEVQQDGQNLNYLSDEQVDVYLKLFETYIDQRPKITKPDDWQGQRYHDRYQGEAGDMDNITRLNVHSNIDPDNLLQENEIEKIKQRLNGDFMVLVVDNSKRTQVDDAIKKFNVLVQGYTNSMNLQNDIRDRKDNVTIAVIDRQMLDKIPAIKKKYPHTAFILQSDNPHDEGIEVYRPYLSGQIKKIADLDKLIAQLYQQNERIRFNVESNRAASRFQVKRTSIVDLSNNQRFAVGLSNQKSKKAFLFFKEPQNNHVRMRLSQQFTNISCVPYKSVKDFKRLIDTYNNYTSILIANGSDIPELQEFVSKKKEIIYLIRFNPPLELRDNPKVKKLFSTYNRDDLERFIMEEFQKISMILPYDGFGQKYKSTKNAQAKKYIQKYEPNTFGTTPRFARDFVPPKSKESTYSRRYMKSNSKSRLASRLQTLSPKAQRNEEYYQG